MTAALVFKIANLCIIPAWILLVLSPRGKLTQSLIHSGLFSALYGVIYLGALLLSHLTSGTGGFDSLESVRLLFSNDWALLAGWIHYLAFDLFIGAHVIKGKNDNLMIRFIIAFLTFMFGPIGYLASRLIPSQKVGA